MLGLPFATKAVRRDDSRIVKVSLTDPSIVFQLDGHYNASTCGGTISLPLFQSCISLPFTGSDIEIDLLPLPNEDSGLASILPDAAYLYTKPRFSGQMDSSPAVLNCSLRVTRRYSLQSGYQLKDGNHTLELCNTRMPGESGGILVAAISYYIDPLSSSIPTWVPWYEKSTISKDTIVAASFGGVAGAISVFVLIAVLRQRSRQKIANRQGASLGMTKLGSSEAFAN